MGELAGRKFVADFGRSLVELDARVEAELKRELDKAKYQKAQYKARYQKEKALAAVLRPFFYHGRS